MPEKRRMGQDGLLGRGNSTYGMGQSWIQVPMGSCRRQGRVAEAMELVPWLSVPLPLASSPSTHYVAWQSPSLGMFTEISSPSAALRSISSSPLPVLCAVRQSWCPSLIPGPVLPLDILICYPIQYLGLFIPGESGFV